MSLAAYVLMLYAYRLAPATPVLAVGQCAPALAAGTAALGERLTTGRALGTAAIVAGALLLAALRG